MLTQQTFVQDNERSNSLTSYTSYASATSAATSSSHHQSRHIPRGSSTNDLLFIESKFNKPSRKQVGSQLSMTSSRPQSQLVVQQPRLNSLGSSNGAQHHFSLQSGSTQNMLSFNVANSNKSARKLSLQSQQNPYKVPKLQITSPSPSGSPHGAPVVPSIPLPYGNFPPSKHYLPPNQSYQSQLPSPKYHPSHTPRPYPTQQQRRHHSHGHRPNHDVPFTFPNGEVYIPRSKQKGSYTNLQQLNQQQQLIYPDLSPKLPPHQHLQPHLQSQPQPQPQPIQIFSKKLKPGFYQQLPPDSYKSAATLSTVPNNNNNNNINSGNGIRANHSLSSNTDTENSDSTTSPSPSGTSRTNSSVTETTPSSSVDDLSFTKNGSTTTPTADSFEKSPNSFNNNDSKKGLGMIIEASPGDHTLNSSSPKTLRQSNENLANQIDSTKDSKESSAELAAKLAGSNSSLSTLSSNLNPNSSPNPNLDPALPLPLPLPLSSRSRSRSPSPSPSKQKSASSKENFLNINSSPLPSYAQPPIASPQTLSASLFESDLQNTGLPTIDEPTTSDLALLPSAKSPSTPPPASRNSNLKYGRLRSNSSLASFQSSIKTPESLQAPQAVKLVKKNSIVKRMFSKVFRRNSIKNTLHDLVSHSVKSLPGSPSSKSLVSNGSISNSTKGLPYETTLQSTPPSADQSFTVDDGPIPKPKQPKSNFPSSPQISQNSFIQKSIGASPSNRNFHLNVSRDDNRNNKGISTPTKSTLTTTTTATIGTSQFEKGPIKKEDQYDDQFSFFDGDEDVGFNNEKEELDPDVLVYMFAQMSTKGKKQNGNEIERMNEGNKKKDVSKQIQLKLQTTMNGEAKATNLEEDADAVVPIDDIEMIEKIIEFGETSFPDLASPDLGQSQRKLIRSKSIERKLSSKSISSANSKKSRHLNKDQNETAAIENDDGDYIEEFSHKYYSKNSQIEIILTNQPKEPLHNTKSYSTSSILKKNPKNFFKNGLHSHNHSHHYNILPPHHNNHNVKQNKTPSKKVGFTNQIYVNNTYPSHIYNRHSRSLSSCHLSPYSIQQIRYELNEFKSKMDVHEASKTNTHFFH